VGIEKIIDIVTGQVNMGDDPRDTRLSTRRDRRYIVGFTETAEVIGPIGAVAGSAFHEDRRNDPVARIEVGGEFRGTVWEHVTGWPEVMVGIHDLEFGFDDVLDDEVVPLRSSRCR
jgi:hypothetical protein